MPRLRIAVVGSADPDRAYPVPIQDTALARTASEQLGAEFARRGCDLVVFSGRPTFADRDFARGYAGSGVSAGTILVMAPEDQHEQLPAPGRSAIAVEYRPSPYTDWEVPFFRAILDADGVVLIGGGRATLTAGVVAIASGTPMIALASFGGAARQVWADLDGDGTDVPDEERAAMARPWTDESAPALVGLLLAQAERKRARTAAADAAARRVRHRAGWSYAACAALLLAAVATVPAIAATSGAAGLALLLSAPMLASVAGALIRDSFVDAPVPGAAAARGLGAGVVSTLLYVASQALASGQPVGSVAYLRLAFLVIPIGFIAGFTFDHVYAQLRRTVVIRTSAVDAGPS